MITFLNNMLFHPINGDKKIYSCLRSTFICIFFLIFVM